MNWQDNIINNNAGIRTLLHDTRTIAVLGIKTEAQAKQPAFYVPNGCASKVSIELGRCQYHLR